VKDEGFAEWRLYGEGLSSLLKELVRNLTHCVVFLARSLLLAFDISKTIEDTEDRVPDIQFVILQLLINIFSFR
jgi:hypothetical protein